MSTTKALRLDVREDIKNRREPFARIMQAVSRLSDDQDFVLVAPFEPTPLYAVLGQQGFEHAANELPSGDWEVRFSREPQACEPGNDAAATSSLSGAVNAKQVLEVDARGLEPPQPLVTILEAVSTLPEGAELRALTERRPMHLYSQLKDRGFQAETIEQPDGSFVTHIVRAQ